MVFNFIKIFLLVIIAACSCNNSLFSFEGEIDVKEQFAFLDKGESSTFNKEFFKTIGLVFGSVITYGILHDQVTARLCPEYFNSEAVPHHKSLLDKFGLTKASPTIIAFFWGFMATWWVALPLGLGTALSSRVGKWPKLKAKDMLKYLGIMIGINRVFVSYSWYIGLYVI
jgi:hypothetical protein